MSPNMPSSETQADSPLHLRPGTASDQVALFRILIDSVWDLAWRIGIKEDGRAPTEAERTEEFQKWQPFLNHLAATADQFWVAEREGKALGYARSVLRDGVRELTEFFVATDAQTAGIGRELLARAMPPGAKRNYIIATLDLRAQARYHKLGLYQQCAVYTFSRKPEDVAEPQNSSGDLTLVSLTSDHLPMLAQLDLAIHGHRRDEDHAWLIQDRAGFLLLRQEQPVGYGYVGSYSGPFVMLAEADFPAALAHAESVAAKLGLEEFGVDVPMLNHTAITYLLGRGYKMSPFFCFLMCDAQPQRIHKTIITSPMIMI